MRTTLITLFFVAQIGLIFFNLNTDAKFFNWAMYHTNITYSASVSVNGVELDSRQFLERYKIPKTGIESWALAILQRKMVRRELLSASGDHVSIRLNYTENTHAGFWSWKK